MKSPPLAFINKTSTELCTSTTPYTMCSNIDFLEKLILLVKLNAPIYDKKVQDILGEMP